MADINVERKPRSMAPLLLALLLVVVIAAAAWWYLGSPDRDAAEAPPASEVQGSPNASGTMNPAAPPPGSTTPDTTGY